ncbi:MAG: phytanoyl-CoA dioxygenase family protein [Rhodobacteraceae bacterium]|nr:phytanoyl-CoA dioxygenase family protein [Paracoccaceae bacterium]
MNGSPSTVTADTTPFDAASVSTDARLIYRDVRPSPAEIADAVRQWGIVVLPRFVDGAQLKQLNDEFDSLINQRRSRDFGVDEFDNIVNVRVIRDRLDATQFPQVASLFGSEYMNQVAENYYGSGNYRLNGEIFVSELSATQGPQPNPPFALHFDKRNVLKFFIYLSNTDERNGAMRALPGSHMRNRRVREHEMVGTTLQNIENVFPEPLTPSIPISGSAGTMFVFDTDVCHGASTVEPGLTRRTMRGHTHSHAMLNAMAADFRAAHGTH